MLTNHQPNRDESPSLPRAEAFDIPETAQASRLLDKLFSLRGQQITPAVCMQIMAAFDEPDASIDPKLDPKQFAAEYHGGFMLQAERFVDVLDEIHPLHEAHWLETEKHRHGIEFKPDYEAVLASERAGQLVQFTARDADYKLVGNLRMYLGHSRHTSTTFAEEDTLYLAPEARNGSVMLAIKMMRYAERCLLEIGVREIRADSKLVNNADALMRRLGYEAVALKFVKVFKEPPCATPH